MQILENSTGGFKQTSGYRIGRNEWLSINASWPFASIELQGTQLELRGWSSPLIFSPSNVTKISTKRGWFSSGLKIEHSIGNYPIYVVLWLRKPDELLKHLKDAGYTVA